MASASKFNRGNVFLIAIAHFFHDLYFAILAPVFPLLIQKFGLSYFQISLVGLTQTLPNLLNPFIGALADRLRMRYLVIFAPAVSTIAMSLIGLAPHYILILILVFVAGTSSAFFHVPTPVMIKKLSGDKVGKGMSAYMFGGEAARTAGPLVIVWAISMWGLEGTYRLMPLGLAASAVLFFKFRNLEISQMMEKKEKPTGYGRVLRKHARFFIIIGGYLFFRALMKSGLTQFLPTYINIEKGQTLALGASALSVLQIAALAGTMFSGTLSDKIGRKQSLLLIAIVSPVFMWLFVHAQSQVMMYLWLVLIGLTHFATGPVLLALVQDQKTDRPAFVNSLYMMIAFSIASLAGLIVGRISDAIGLAKTYEYASYLAYLGIPFIAMLPQKNK